MNPIQGGAPPRHALSPWVRWLSLRGYGMVTSTLFGATTPPLKMRARFERLARVSRQRLLRKFPKLVFEDHRAGELGIESVRAVESPKRVLLNCTVAVSSWARPRPTGLGRCD